MPPPKSTKFRAVNVQEFKAPFTTPTRRLGMGGLQLNKALDSLDHEEYQVLTNVTHHGNGEIVPRYGQESVATSGGTENHSLVTLLNPAPGAPAGQRFFGIDTSLYQGRSGALSSIQSGFSGDPLTFALARPPLSGEPWAYIADRTQMKKVRQDGLVLDIGLAPPTVRATTALATEKITNIAEFDSADSTEAANWTGHAGTSAAGTAETDYASKGGHVGFRIELPDPDLNYFSFWAMERPLNLNKVGSTSGGEVDSIDDDHIHFWLKFSDPSEQTEIRIYFIVSDDFDAADEGLPGTRASVNSEFYVKTIRPGDLALFIAGFETAESAVAAEAATSADEGFVETDDLTEEVDIESGQNTGTGIYDPQLADTTQQDAKSKSAGKRGPSGSHEWLEYGIAGRPFRKTDFRRQGSDPDRDWGTVTGIILATFNKAGRSGEMYFSNMRLTGGGGPDNANPGLPGYDHRYTHYDPRTGVESNPSPIMGDDVDPASTDDWLFAVRRSIDITPTSFGDSEIRQRFYRRGGTFVDDWAYVGENASDGAVFNDNETDLAVFAADTLEIDNDQPVTSVDADGDELLDTPIACLFGPIAGYLLGCGDPNRGGHLFWSKLEEPDHWPALNNVEVCSPSEELMTGTIFGGEAYVFSRERLYAIYPNLAGDNTVVGTPTACQKGIASRWCLANTPGGMAFVSRGEGIYMTTGGMPELLSWDLDPLMRGETVSGYGPVDWTKEDQIRLTYHEHDIWFKYEDQSGTIQVFVYHIVTKTWRHYSFGVAPSGIFSEVIREAGPSGNEPGEPRLLFGGNATGDAYYHTSTSDDGAAIACDVFTSYWDADMQRAEKLLGDMILDCNPKNTVLTVQQVLNDGDTTIGSQTITGADDRDQFVFDPFGTSPVSARNIASRITWSSGANRPELFLLGVSVIAQPDVITRRVTDWDDLGHGSEKYVTGVNIEADTYNAAIDLIAEYDLNGAFSTASTLSLTSDGRHKFFFTWPVVMANNVRLRPTTTACGPWKLFRADWIFDPEPDRINGFDSNWENHWDTWYTGLDIEIDTLGVAKTAEIYVDQVLIQTETITTTGRTVHHVTLPPARGHVYRYVFTDANPGKVYTHRWHLEQEPSEQTNWNQNYTIMNTLADKYVKGIVLECDTANVAKAFDIEIDGTVALSDTVTANDRTVHQFSFAQAKGRVIRLLSDNTVSSRLYSWQLIYDDEPFELARWETQETDHGIPMWHTLLFGHITHRSSADITLTITSYRQDGTSSSNAYTISHGTSAKRKSFVPLNAVTGIMHKYVLTSSVAFALYREESQIAVQPWGAEQWSWQQPFGSDDYDQVREMTPQKGLSNTARVIGEGSI